MKTSRNIRINESVETWRLLPKLRVQ